MISATRFESSVLFQSKSVAISVQYRGKITALNFHARLPTCWERAVSCQRLVHAASTVTPRPAAASRALDARRGALGASPVLAASAPLAPARASDASAARLWPDRLARVAPSEGGALQVSDGCVERLMSCMQCCGHAFPAAAPVPSLTAHKAYTIDRMGDDQRVTAARVLCRLQLSLHLASWKPTLPVIWSPL